MNRRCLPLCVAILTLPLLVSAQSRVDERGVYHPTEEELVAVKRWGELLRKPSFISVRLVAIPSDRPEKPTETPPPYKVGERIHFQLMCTHFLYERLWLSETLNSDYLIRPELFRDGDLLPYSKEAQARVDRTEREPASGSAGGGWLEPRREYECVRVNLEEWYEPLGPGRYQVSVRRRFIWDGEWINSSSVIFEVKPDNPRPNP